LREIDDKDNSDIFEYSSGDSDDDGAQFKSNKGSDSKRKQSIFDKELWVEKEKSESPMQKKR